MKEVLSLFTFVIGAVCFVVFFAVLKPNAVSAVPGTSKPEYCKHGSFAYAHFAARASLPQARGLTLGGDSELYAGRSPLKRLLTTCRLET